MIFIDMPIAASVGTQYFGPADYVAPVLYRYEETKYAAPLDEHENPCGNGSIVVYLYRYRIIKRTPKGCWIDLWGDKRFVRNEGRKRYALPTIKEAKESFIARKLAQIRIYRTRINIAQSALAAIAATSPSHD